MKYTLASPREEEEAEMARPTVQAAIHLHGIKSALDALNDLPRSAIEASDLAEVEELLGRLWRPRDTRRVA